MRVVRPQARRRRSRLLALLSRHGRLLYASPARKWGVMDTVRATSTEIALDKAGAILQRNQSPLGVMGARKAYQQVWARDAAITGLGLMLSERAGGAELLRRSLETLRAFQSELGNIPHCVGIPSRSDPALIALHQYKNGNDHQEELVPQADTAHAGCVDSSLWYILAQYYHFRITGDAGFLHSSWPSMEKALLWLRYQDSNECGLLEVHEAMDWSDLFANKYNVLYDNVLYYASLRAMGELREVFGADGSRYRAMAADVRKKINTLLWVGPEHKRDLAWIEANRREWLYPVKLTDLVLVQRPYYLPYMAFRDYCDRCDLFGNVLAILFGVADECQTRRILEYIQSVGLDEPYPVRVLHPVVYPGDKDWREYYLIRNLNLPYQYHNGGIWPFIGGFYVAALLKAGMHEHAARHLGRLAELNRLGREEEWEFNEWFHGQSGRPMGFANQSWSAGMYIYAYRSVEEGEPIVFNRTYGW